MKTRNRQIGFFSIVYGLLAAVLILSCAALALLNANASPILVQQPQAAMDQIQTMLDALCAGEYQTVSTCLYGQPNLGLDREAEDPVGQLFWTALEESFSYEIAGEFHATDSGVALNVSISALDINSVTLNLRQRAQALMENQIAQAEDTDEIYDENNEYREEFVMGSLYQAARDALAEDAQYVTQELTVKLVYENGQWWNLPEQDLLRVISGGTLQ